MSEIAIIEHEEIAEVHPVVHGTLFGTDNPSEVIERATGVADALADIVRKQKLTTNIQGREHVRVEGWTLLGSMLGVFPIVVWTKEVGDGQGWEARVEARTRDGAIVGAAEAECLRSEKTWSKRESYALKSMAQTRATSKALRHPLGFVMAMAGFEVTPEEEMPGSARGTGPEVLVETDGKKPEKMARSWSEWAHRMEELEVPQPVEWANSATETIGGKTKAGNILQRANTTLLWFADNTPESSLGFWSVPEIQEGFARGWDGALVEPPKAPEPKKEEE